MTVTVLLAINGQPYRVETTKLMEEVYLAFLVTPRTLEEIADHLSTALDVSLPIAKGIHFTLSTRFFLSGRRIHNNFLAPPPKRNLWWATEVPG